MIKAPKFADAIGRKKMAESLGVGLTAVSNAVSRGKFPASWFTVCETLAEIEGVECPPALFGHKVPHTPQNVNGKRSRQGA